MNMPPHICDSSGSTPLDLGAAARSELLEVARDVVDAIGAVSAVVTVISGDHQISVSTDPAGAELDRIQRETGDGPTPAAVDSGEVIRVNSTTADDAFPEFRAACRRHGVYSAASAPIVNDSIVVGTLAVYSDEHHCFGANEMRTVRDATRALAVIIAGH